MHNFTLILKTDLSMDDLAELCYEHVGDATLVSCCGVLTLDFERASKSSREATILQAIAELGRIGIRSEPEP